ncbi:MAG: L-threonylcarbamoyladenylate synthase [Rhodobacteraceae bacterium]|nr:L-threonylcarbamoyladenylate synthase [Paracoccaceae bacterium]
MLDKVIKILDGGGVALLPTDTVYGLMARPDLPAAVARIFALKNRPANKNLQVLLGDISQLDALGVMPDARINRLVLAGYIPGALSFVLGLDQARTPAWLLGRSELALRLPDDPFLRELILQTGPLMATSANKSGQETQETPEGILRQLYGKPDITRDDGPRSGAASTLINSRTTPFTVERRGALSEAALREVLAI